MGKKREAPNEGGEAEAIARLRGAGAKGKARGDGAASKEGRINWTGVREEYVTGTETFAQLAQRLGVPVKTLEYHAAELRESSGSTWGELRASFREDVAHRFRSEATAKQVDAALGVHEAQAQWTQKLVDAALPVAIDALESGSVVGIDAVRSAVSALAAQRKVHGLDRVPLKVEVTGEDSGPIKHDIPLGGKLDDGIADLAKRALEAVFGESANSG